MSIETKWNLTADIQAEMETEGGVFENVVTQVHWRCTATDSDGGESLTRYGAKTLPPPTSAESYIDLSVLQDMEETGRRATVLGWAESIEPGFVEATEKRVKSALKDKMTAPVKTTAKII